LTIAFIEFSSLPYAPPGAIAPNLTTPQGAVHHQMCSL
jgi:hypothetical protein